MPGISEDVAFLIAYEKGAELIVAVGTHFNLIEFLERDRAGMSSTFVTRLKVGEILIDAKGVSRLVAPRVGLWPLVLLAFVGLLAIVVAILASPALRSLIQDARPNAAVSDGHARAARPARGRLGVPRRAVPPRRLVAGHHRRRAGPPRLRARRALEGDRRLAQLARRQPPARDHRCSCRQSSRTSAWRGTSWRPKLDVEVSPARGRPTSGRSRRSPLSRGLAGPGAQAALRPRADCGKLDGSPTR